MVGPAKRLVAVLMSLALLAACGTHLTNQELLAASEGRNAGAGTSVGPSGGDESGPVADGVVTDTGASGAPDAAPQKSPGAADQAQGTQDAVPIPKGGNGGATDVGVTADTITLGLITTLTGPRPGLFRGAALGTQACAQRANSQGGLFGRKLEIKVGDDQLNENQARVLAGQLADQTFAFVGSLSLHDGAMVPAMEAKKVPDIGEPLQPARTEHALNFPPQAIPRGWQLGPLRYLKQKFPEASQALGFLGADLAQEQNDSIKAAAAVTGFKLVYDGSYGGSTQDFTAQVFRMKTQGVRMLVMTGDVVSYARVLQAAQQQGLDLDVFNPIGNAYDPKFFELAGDLAEGTMIYNYAALYLGEDAGTNPEVRDLLAWLKRVDPKARPDSFAVFGWTSCVLFLQAAKAVGPNLTRAALLEQLQKITNFDGNGLLAPSNPAANEAGKCYLMQQFRNGKWGRIDTPAGGFRCDSEFLRR